MTIKIGTYEITTGTAVAVTAGDTDRQPAILVHDITDIFGNGDAVVYGVKASDIPDLTEADVTDLLNDTSSTDYTDLATFFDEVDSHLLDEMKRYIANGYSFDLFAAELGWQDWMNEYTEAADGEPISEAESDRIDAHLKDLWEVASV